MQAPTLTPSQTILLLAVKRAQVVRPIVARGMRTGRNDPCFCGSGKKFKHCHRPVAPATPLTPAGPDEIDDETEAEEIQIENAAAAG